MTTIATFLTPEEAHLFRSYMRAQGIDAALADENLVQLFWHNSNVIGGVRLVVDDEDAAVATDEYLHYMKNLRVGPYSLHPVHAWPVVILVLLIVGVPFLLFGRRSASAPEYVTPNE